MDNLLSFIVKNCSFLYNAYNFKFIDSTVGKSFDNASVIMKNESIYLRFINERSRISLEVGFFNEVINHWFDIDLIQFYLRNKSRGTANLDTENLLFLAEQIGEIQKLVIDDVTKRKLSDLKKIRAKEIFHK